LNLAHLLGGINMNGSMGNMASGAPETPVSENILSLKTVQRMLPLVQRIVDDVVTHQQTLDRLQPEQERLDRQKRRRLPELRRYRICCEAGRVER